MTTGIANVDVKSIFENAMVNLIIEFPVFATLVTRIGCKLVDEPGHGTVAWFDGHGIYINEAMVREFNQNPIDIDDKGRSYNRLITQKEMQFLICHELMHLLTLSFERDRNVGLDPKLDHSPEAIRKYQIWNAAQDYEINSLLHNNEETDQISGDKKRKPIGNMPEWVCYDSKYIDWIAEDIYKDLIENEKRNNGGQLLAPIGDGDPFDGNAERKHLHKHSQKSDRVFRRVLLETIDKSHSCTLVYSCPLVQMLVISYQFASQTVVRHLFHVDLHLFAWDCQFRVAPVMASRRVALDLFC